MTVFLLSNVPQHNADMLHIAQMLCIAAFQLHVWTAVKLDGSQDTSAISICLGLPRTAIHLMRNLSIAPNLPLPLQDYTSRLSSQTGLT